MKSAILMLYLSFLVALTTGLCFADAWHIESVDTVGDVGRDTSIAMDSSDNPHISYYDWANMYDLKYARYDGSSWQIESIDTTGDVGEWTSIALDSSQNPHISYLDDTTADLKHAYYNGSSWQIESVDTAGDVGYFTSIALDSSQNPHISYSDGTNWCLKYAYFDGSSWQIESLDTSRIVGGCTSIALDSSQNPHISYYGYVGGNLMYAHYEGSFWQIETVDTMNDVGWSSSIALDSSQNPHISYCDATNEYLMYAYFDGSSWQIERLDIMEEWGGHISMALDSSDKPHISYYDYAFDDLKYAYYDGLSWQFESVDTGGNVGVFTSIALDSSQNPHISYYDTSNGDLKYAWYVSTLGINLTSFSAEPQGSNVSLHWQVETTEGEQISGFNLYRREITPNSVAEGFIASPERSAPPQNKNDWTQINPSLIIGQNPYAYTDEDVASGITYEYRLEAVLADETAETLGTTQATTAQPTTFAIVSLYPNPAQETMTCLLSVPYAGTVELELYDLSGRMVLKKQINVNEPNEMSAVLDVSSLASGVYTLRATCGGVEASARCVVAR